MTGKPTSDGLIVCKSMLESDQLGQSGQELERTRVCGIASTARTNSLLSMKWKPDDE